LIRGLIPKVIESSLKQGFKYMLILKALETGTWKYRDEIARTITEITGKKWYGNQINSQLIVLKKLGYIVETSNTNLYLPRGIKLKMYKITDDGIYLLRRGTKYLKDMVSSLSFNDKSFTNTESSEHYPSGCSDSTSNY